MAEVILLTAGIYWFSLDYFSKARSTLAVRDQAPSAEVTGSRVGVSLALQLGVRAMDKGLHVFGSRECSLVKTSETSVLSRNATFWKWLVS